MQRTPAQADENFINTKGDTGLIPQGLYCYQPGQVVTDQNGMPQMKVELCPYWAIDPNKMDQQNGYCALIKATQDEGDDDGLSLLWDQVKECGINDDLEDEDFDEIQPWQNAMNAQKG